MHPVIRASLLVTLGCVAAVAGARCSHNVGSWQARAGGNAAKDDPKDEQTAERLEAAAPVRVLLVGNSHSAPLPGLLTQLTAAAKVRAQVTGLTPGGRTLAEHAAAPETAAALSAQRYDIVVLQDQGQVASYARALRVQRMFPAGERLAGAVRGVGAQPWLYVVYARPDGDPMNVPNDTYEAMQQRSDEGYAELAHHIDAPVVPVGSAFLNVHLLRPALPLWNPDGIHASPQGYYIAACVFFAALFNRDPSNIAFDAGLPEEEAAFLRRTAANVVSASAWPP